MSLEMNKIYTSDKLELMDKRQHMLCRLFESKMTIWQWGILTIYLSMLDKNEPDKIVVNIPENTCREIARLDPKGWIWGATTVETERVILRIPLENEDYLVTPLFKECSAYAEFNENEEISSASIRVCTSDMALPLLFGYQKYYFRYKVWHAMHLKNINHVRFYEKIKQYVDVGEISISMTDLRAILGVTSEKYKRWDNFRMRVLDNCQKALETFTDIKFEYKVGIKSGRGGKIQDILFTVITNESYIDELRFERFFDTQHLESILSEEDCFYTIPNQNIEGVGVDNTGIHEITEKSASDEFPFLRTKHIAQTDYEKMVRNSKLEYLRGACNDNFSIEEMGELIDCMNERFGGDVLNDEDLVLCYRFLQTKHISTWGDNRDIPDRLRYMKVLIMSAKNQ